MKKTNALIAVSVSVFAGSCFAFCPMPRYTGNAYLDQVAQQSYYNCVNQEQYQQQQLQMQREQLQAQQQQQWQQQQNQGTNVINMTAPPGYSNGVQVVR